MFFVLYEACRVIVCCVLCVVLLLGCALYVVRCLLWIVLLYSCVLSCRVPCVELLFDVRCAVCVV